VRVQLFDFFSPVNRVSILLRYFSLWSAIFAFELKKTHNRSFYRRNFFSLANNLLLRIGNASNLRDLFGNSNRADFVCYTYWYNQVALSLAILKKMDPKLCWVTRAHGGDYAEKQRKSVFPFRYFTNSQVNKIFPVSSFAKNYFINKFKVPEQRLSVAHLGLQVEGTLSPVESTSLHLVSCSALIPLKRVELIVEILSFIGDHVQWTHFGGGPLIDQIQNKIAKLPSSVKVDLKGYQPNNEFLSFLTQTSVSFFINVSDSEGLPVTMMEAISRGIPLIGPAICGIPEIINTDTGFLISPDFDPADVAKLITSEHDRAGIYSSDYRKKILMFYEHNFSAKENYKKLSKEILQELCAE
jgi:glycosyltransferase involved in cell wall biosynthesis